MSKQIVDAWSRHEAHARKPGSERWALALLRLRLLQALLLKPRPAPSSVLVCPCRECAQGRPCKVPESMRALMRARGVKFPPAPSDKEA